MTTPINLKRPIQVTSLAHFKYTGSHTAYERYCINNDFLMVSFAIEMNQLN